MKREELIIKWMNDDLSDAELESFKELDDYSAYASIAEKAKYFAAPDFDVKDSFAALNQKISKPQKKFIFSYKYVAAAAIFILGFFLLKTFGPVSSQAINYSTQVAGFEEITLPDQSIVNLNSNSDLTFDSQDWLTNRTLNLNGEALFKVEKGETFKVRTSFGDVQVLGTVFNVKSRDYIFQVNCYEGSVRVSIGDENFKLSQNDKLVYDGSNVFLGKDSSELPSWKAHMTVVKDMEFISVLNELKNYYNIQFDTSAIDTSKRFTGSFDNLNINLALNSITLPLGLTYKIDGETVIFDNK